MVFLHVHETHGFGGGAEQYLFNLATELAAQGHGNYLLYKNSTNFNNEKFSEPFLQEFQYTPKGSWSSLPKVDIAYFHTWHLSSGSVKAMLKPACPTFQFIHDHDPLCLRTHKSFYFSGKACRYPIGARCLGCLPFSPKVRSWSVQQTLRPLRTQKQFLEILRAHSGIVVASRYLFAEFTKNKFPTDQILLNPLFTDFSPSFSPLRRGEAPLVLYVGRLDRGKGFDLLVKALEKVQKEFSLLVVGDGKSRSEFIRLTQGMGKRVKFLRTVDHDDLPPLYFSARMVVIPSRSPETFGLTAIEAMAHGRPAVAFRVGALGEIIEDHQTGLLAEEQDLEGLAQHIQRLLLDCELATSLGKSGVKKVQELYQSEIHVQRLVEYFGRVIRQASPVYAEE